MVYKKNYGSEKIGFLRVKGNNWRTFCLKSII